VSNTQHKTQSKSFIAVIFDTVGWPLLMGMATCFGFYFLIRRGIIESELVNRYFATHPVEYVEAALFFVGLSALLIKLIDILGQLSSLHLIEVAPRPESGQPIHEAAEMVSAIDDLPSYLGKTYLGERTKNALQHVARKKSADDIDDHLKHLSDMDAARQHDGYALIRIIIWATPMLGFLGTVIGITLALGNLSPQALVEAPEQAMEGLLASLSVAFDTTALALCLSIFLMFGQYLSNVLETELLLAVDARTTSDLVGRFEPSTSGADASINAVRRMTQLVMDANQQASSVLIDAVQQSSDAVIESNQQTSQAIAGQAESIVKNHSEIWQQAYQDSQTQWAEVVDGLRNRLGEKLDDAFYHSFSRHVEKLEQAEQNSSERTNELWSRIQNVLVDNAQVMKEQQTELVRQGDQLLKATSDTAGRTPTADVLAGLTAAISLLNVRLGATRSGPKAVRREQAA